MKAIISYTVGHSTVTRTISSPFRVTAQSMKFRRRLPKSTTKPLFAAKGEHESMSIKQRIRIEKQIVTRAVKDALKAGYALNIDYGDGMVFQGAITDRARLLAGIMQGDDDRIYYYDARGQYAGWAWFVYGNDGWDALSDYTVNLEGVLTGANKLANRYAD
jgi:hypothetical protein